MVRARNDNIAANFPPMSQPSADEPLTILEMGTMFGVGGITRHILGLRTWLVDRGHSVPLAGTPDAWVNGQSGLPLLELSTRFVAGEGGSLPSRLGHVARSAWVLRRWLKANPVDLIHAHESAPALVANIARKGLGVPLAVTYHGSEPERIAQFGKISRQADLVITPSHRSADDLAEIGGVPREKLKVIGLGLKPAPEDPADEIAALREKLLGDGTHLILTIARLMHQKGIDILIDCVARMKETHPGFRFVVAGDGPDEKMLHRLAEERGVTSHLTFVGRTERPHLHLRASDLFLLTSRWEALPFTIAEAFQTGTPSVAAACSGVVELIDDSVGRVVPIGDVDAICAGVAEVLSDEPARLAMSAAALERSREDRFDPNWINAEFERTYRDLAELKR